MAIEQFINIGKLGITGAIKQKLLEENISIKNFDISVWQEIMDTIKDDENFKKIYSGSTNLKDKNAFQVAKETTVQISESLWNKILNIALRHNGTFVETEQSTVSQINDKPDTKIDLKSTYPNLPFTENGEIDFDSFTLDRLKKQFPDKDFIIDTDNNDEGQFINVRSKKDNNFVFSYSNINSPNGNKIRSVAFKDNGKPIQLNYTNDIFTSRMSFNINAENYLIDTVESYDENRNLIQREIWNKDNTSYVSQNYSNGILCSEYTYKKNVLSEDNFNWETIEEKNILSDNLIKDINTRIKACEDGIGFLPKTDDIENNILNGISKNNVMAILTDYRDATERSLIQDIIDDKMGLGYQIQKEMLLHLTNTARESNAAKHDKEHCFEGQSIGYELQFALKHNEKDMLKEALDKVNKDNVEYVLRTIFNTNNNTFFSDYSDKLYSQLLQMFGVDAGEYISKFANAMILNIYEKGGYVKDIVEDLNSHTDSWNKSVIDFTRLLNRCNAGQKSTSSGKPDGKIDINNIQQKGTGDCWLIASVLSATNKNQKGLDYINSMLSVDSNGNVTVKLKGVNKKYVISAEEIEKSNHLASGDPDLRAIEIAVDKFMKEYSYEQTDDGSLDFSRADLNGDFGDFAYKILFGKGYSSEEQDIDNIDFNAENVVYSLSFNNNPSVKATILGGEEESKVDLLSRHAYAIKSSDEKYIYLINPHNSSETLQVERTLLQTKNPKIYYANL